MKILYLGYWSAADGLTQSVIVPRLKILSTIDHIEEIFFCSIERDTENPLKLNLPKITQSYFFSKRNSFFLLTKLTDFTGLYLMLNELVRQKNISVVICNSPLAGIVGYHLHKRNRIPYVVECFEPHALYMLESGAWKSWDPRYLILTYYERKQKKTAWKLATVSEKYTARLVREGVPAERILTIPNCIPLDEFRFNDTIRSQKRSELSVDEKGIVGIYVGKFGDIYYDEEAFDLFSEAFNFFGADFSLVILSSIGPSIVKEKLEKRNIRSKQVHVMQVTRDRVPAFLSASDFAFSTIKPSPARIYCCPVKDGEYWANGLPVLLEEGIGDDSDIIRTEGGGVILVPGQSGVAFKRLALWMKKGRLAVAEEIFPVAVKHRRMEFLWEYYQKLFDPGQH